MNKPTISYSELTGAARGQLLEYYSNFFGVSKMTIEDWILSQEVIIDPNELKLTEPYFTALENFIQQKQG